MPNGEVIKFPGSVGLRLIDPPDVAVHFPVQVFQQAVHLAIRPFHDQFDATIRQISDVAPHVVLHR